MDSDTVEIINGINASGEPFECFFKDGRIAYSKEKGHEQCSPFDADGKVILPGMVDMHVHFRDPWEDDSKRPGESITSGLSAALNGGVTTSACMPNTIPPIDEPGIVQYIVEKSRQIGKGHVFPIAAITKGREGRELVDFDALLNCGAVAFSDDGNTLMSASLMRRALEISRLSGFVIITHSLDETGYKGWVFNEGKASRRFEVLGIPNSAEYRIVERDIKLAKETGGNLHIAHLSTEESLELVKRAKEDGVNVTCEVCPHHLILSDEDIVEFDANFKISPPLRSSQDKEALLEGLKSGVIDVIASDHAPHPPEGKKDCNTGLRGITGVETMLFLINSEIVAKQKVLSLQEAVHKMAERPAEILGIEMGSLEEGRPADILIFDPEKEWECELSFFRSMSSNTPFKGWTLKGSIKDVFVNGKQVTYAN